MGEYHVNKDSRKYGDIETPRLGHYRQKEEDNLNDELLSDSRQTIQEEENEGKSSQVKSPMNMSYGDSKGSVP